MQPVLYQVPAASFIFDDKNALSGCLLPFVVV